MVSHHRAFDCSPKATVQLQEPETVQIRFSAWLTRFCLVLKFAASEKNKLADVTALPLANFLYLV